MRRRVLIAALGCIVAASVARADRGREAPPAPPEPFAVACGEAFEAAGNVVGKQHKTFRDRPSFVSSSGRSSAIWGHQFGAELYYAEALDVRGNSRGFERLVRAQGVWACRETISGRQHNVDCVLQRGHHIAVLRAIHDGKRPRRVAPFLAAFKGASERCLP